MAVFVNENLNDFPLTGGARLCENEGGVLVFVGAFFDFGVELADGGIGTGVVIGDAEGKRRGFVEALDEAGVGGGADGAGLSGGGASGGEGG